jgi:hypothetical protein
MDASRARTRAVCDPPVVRRTSPSGTFTINASIAGKNGPVSIVPPDPGTDACFVLQLGVGGTSGDRYDVLFGPGSKITNKDATLFKAMKPPAEGVCPFGPTTTTTTTTTSTTTTTMASPSGAFLDDAALGAG